MRFFCDCLFDFWLLRCHIIGNASKHLIQTFTHRPLTGQEGVSCLFLFKETCLRNQRGLLTNSQKKTDMKKEPKAYNMFFFFGVGGGSKKLIQISQAPMMSEFFMSWSCLSWDLGISSSLYTDQSELSKSLKTSSGFRMLKNKLRYYQ